MGNNINIINHLAPWPCVVSPSTVSDFLVNGVLQIRLANQGSFWHPQGSQPSGEEREQAGRRSCPTYPCKRSTMWHAPLFRFLPTLYILSSPFLPHPPVLLFLPSYYLNHLDVYGVQGSMPSMPLFPRPLHLFFSRSCTVPVQPGRVRSQGVQAEGQGRARGSAE